MYFQVERRNIHQLHCLPFPVFYYFNVLQNSIVVPTERWTHFLS